MRCRLSDVILTAVEQLKPTAESQDIGITITAPGWIAVSVRSKSMGRVFVNLISNALESMSRGGQISISVKVATGHVTVTIDDTGRGVPEELRPKLFKAFVSGDKKNGIGLGLLLSRQTLLDHGGDLWLEDKAGPGARFCLRLPLEPATGPACDVRRHLDDFKGQS
jgi:signal transduction histidine kinase